MILYDNTTLKKLFGTLGNVPDLEADDVVNYRDSEGVRVPVVANDTYKDDGKGGIFRLSDGKKINIFIDETNIVPGNFIVPTVHSTPTRVEDYLYEITYNTYDINNFKSHYDKIKPIEGACSAVRSGNFLGRNLDWYYDNKVSFVVRVPAQYGRHASIGIADCVDSLTKAAVESGEELEAYKYLPYATVDGINDAGVVVETNVVMDDYGFVNNLNPGKVDLCTIAIPRLVLDYADSAKDALKIFDKYNFFGTSRVTQEDPHYMIADSEATYIVEFIENQVHIMSDQDDEYDDIPNRDTPIMTNFHESFWNGETKLVWKGDSFAEVAATGIEPHAMGVERYEILKNAYTACENFDDMATIMDTVKYTKLYTNISLDDLESPDIWRTESVRDEWGFSNDLTVYTSMDDWKSTLIELKQQWDNRSRDTGKCWQTVHCSIYDMINKKLFLRVQEQDNGYTYTL